jgi:L-seryl-tRNA(Ser) seleniumtransferase
MNDEALDPEAIRIFGELGARPVINAAGAYTLLGGSTLSPAVRAAMDAANEYFVDMKGLADSSGRVIAEMLGAESALVTAGAAAALVLSVAACLTIDRPEYYERLPECEGIPNQVVVQKSRRQKYDRTLSIAGARVVEAGDDNGMTLDQLAEAIGPDTAAVHYFVPLQGHVAGQPVLEDVVRVAHEKDVPVIVDAAGHTYPTDGLRKFARTGADLVCYAAKYFDAPHSTGLIVGRKDLVDVASINSFVGFETSGYLTIGRPMKVDRQEIAGCVVALREWLAVDHEARLQTYADRIDVILRELRSVPGIEAVRVSEIEQPAPVMRDGVRIRVAPGRADDVMKRLQDGEPSIWVRTYGDFVNVSVAWLPEAQVGLVARRLREALTQ